MTKVVFPSFSTEGIGAPEMRQLVSALELRFQALEEPTESLFVNQEENFSLVGHTHTESEVTDLQPYLIDITAESIFDLSDVEGTPQDNWVLVWSNAQDAFVVQSPGAAAAVALNDLSDVSVPAPIDEDVLSWDQGSGQWVASAIASGGVNTLLDLLDTDIAAQLQYDLLFNADGTEWQPTGQDFQWFPGQYLQLGNSTAINWYDAVATSVEHLAFVNTVVGAPPATDPDIGSVTLLVSAETADVGAGTFTADIGDTGWTYTGTPTSGVEQGHISDTSFKHGAKSVYVLGATGATFEGLVGPAANSTEAAVFFPIGLQEFTIEWWIDPTSDNTETPPNDGRWTNDKEIISSFNTQQASAEAMHIAILTDGDLEFWTPVSGGRDITFTQVPNGLGTTVADWHLEGWTHWAITRESDGEFRAWCQGVLQGTTGIGPYPSRSTLSLIQPTNTQTVNFGCGQRNGQVPNGSASGAYIDDVRITLGVARYTTAGGNFTPPGPLDGTIGEETFIVGDPGYATQIDGLTVEINADTSLNTGSSLTIYDSTGVDSLAMSHDGSDLFFDFTNTNNFWLRGTGSLFLDATGVPGTAAMGLESSAANTASSLWAFNSESNQYAELNVFGTTSGNAPHLYYSDSVSETLELQGDSGVIAQWINSPTKYYDLVRGTHLRIYDSTTADFADFSHDGTDFNIDFGGTTALDFTGLTTINLFDGPELVFWNSGNVNSVAPGLFGTVFDIDTTNVTDFQIQSLSGDFWIRDGAGLKISDSGDTDWAIFHHDSTDFNQNFELTTDYNIDPGQALTGQVKIFTDTHFVSGAAVQIRDSTNNDNVTFAHDGDHLVITETNTGNIQFPATGTLGLDMTDNTILTPILQDNATEADAPTVSANAVTLDYTAGPMFEVDMEPATATVAVTISGGPPAGTHGRIVAKFQQDGGTAQTLTWAGGTFRWDGGTAHPMNTTLDGFSIYIFDTWDGGTTWYGKGADFS